MASRPKIYVAVSPEHVRHLFDATAQALLKKVGEVKYHSEPRDVNSAELAEGVRGQDAVITCWGTPTFTPEVLQNADRLKLLAHSAGSIKHIFPVEVFDRGIAVTHAAPAIATAVADFSLMVTMLMMRRVMPLYEKVRHGDWNRGGEWPSGPERCGHEINGARIGVVACGYTGRRFIHLLKALDAEVWVYDPYLKPAEAKKMGVKKVELLELFSSCHVVSLQAPVTKETERMVGAKELAALHDGGILIDTARGVLVDQAALLKELQSGRISAALDTFDPEPPPPDSPLFKLNNVFVTPHMAGASIEARRQQGLWMAEEVQRFFKGEPLKYGVKKNRLDIMA